MTELIADVDRGTLPPRTRKIYSEVGAAIEQGWKPIELAQKLGVSPSFLSECIAELRTVLGLLNGVFPTVSEEAYRELLASIAHRGVEVPLVVDEHGVIDGHARLRACKELAHIYELDTTIPDWGKVAENAIHDRGDAVEMYGRDTVDAALYLADLPDGLIEAARARRFDDPPVDRRAGLTPRQRVELAITLNAHRRHLQRGELRLLVEVELMRDKDRSNAAIGRLVGCTAQYVGQVRQQVAEDEHLFANPQADVETKPVSVPWRPVVELDCPHCAEHLALSRAGRDFRLEITA